MPDFVRRLFAAEQSACTQIRQSAEKGVWEGGGEGSGVEEKQWDV